MIRPLLHTLCSRCSTALSWPRNALTIFDFSQTKSLFAKKVDASLAFNNTIHTSLAPKSDHSGSAPSILVGVAPIRVNKVNNMLQMDYGSAGSILWQQMQPRPQAIIRPSSTSALLRCPPWERSPSRFKGCTYTDPIKQKNV